ncbi:fatty acid CoA ligase family protein [Planctomicrobium sp. SH668]|uniref:fatty acid CoA ligase family protein n=1 Tax=Planctomicrobium sp. SH668 TaxID=3448126 RepID=UPI003F5BB977
MTNRQATPLSVNISQRLTEHASRTPHQLAIAQTTTRRRDGSLVYRTLTFEELDKQSDLIAAGLLERGLTRGMKMVLFVPFGIEFVTLTFALFKAGAVIVLIDPGMGRKNIFNCLKEVKPDGFVAVPAVHLIRMFSGKALRKTRFNVCVGPKLPGTQTTYRQLLKTDPTGISFRRANTNSSDQAAIIFTSGSTGAPKGVSYEHGMFDAQVQMIQSYYNIQPGEVDLPGFPLFGLFNAAMGVTTIIPHMDPTKPAKVHPPNILRAINDHNVTQAFGSPAFWNRVGRYCIEKKITLPTLNRALSAGGPVPTHVLRKMDRILVKPGAGFFTPYGATESLPVCSISAAEVLQETAIRTSQGAGTCVGTSFPGVEVKIIEITDGPIGNLSEVRELPAGEIGEIIVCSPSVTREYYLHPEATALAKIPDGARFWHRIGDVGYLSDDQHLWFCGRKAHIVEATGERMFSVCCEAIFNEHPAIYRSALVGIGSKPNQIPVIVAEPEAGQFPTTPGAIEALKAELIKLGSENPLTARIQHVLLHESLPVDTRHNVKINREALGQWAQRELPNVVGQESRPTV